jgi:hypothetical protein
MLESKINNQATVVPQFKMRTSLKSGNTTGGGYVNGTWYPDMSGYCTGETVTPTPPPTTPPPPTGSGGWVSGVWYPDMSGYCAV